MSLRQQREIETLKEQVADLESRYDRLIERVEALEVKRGPGRPKQVQEPAHA